MNLFFFLHNEIFTREKIIWLVFQTERKENNLNVALRLDWLNRMELSDMIKSADYKNFSRAFEHKNLNYECKDLISSPKVEKKRDFMLYVY